MVSTSLSFFLPFFLTIFPLSQALVNITIDDQDSRISYVPRSSWSLAQGIDSDYGGTHIWTKDPNAYAVITLKFVSFYVLAPKFPYRVATDIVIDGGDHVLVNMQDYDSPDVGSGPGTVSYRVVASWIGTESEEHTLRFSIPAGGVCAVLDGFIFEALHNNDINVTTSTPTGTSPGTGATPSSQNSNSRGLSKNVTIAVAVISTVLAMLLIFLIWWALTGIRGCCRKDRMGDRPVDVPDNEDIYPLDRYDTYLPRLPPPAEYAPPRRNRPQGRRLARSSHQDGLAGVGRQPQGGGRPPRFYGYTASSIMMSY